MSMHGYAITAGQGCCGADQLVVDVVYVEQETMALSEEEQKKLKSDKYGAVEEIRCGPDPTNKPLID